MNTQPQKPDEYPSKLAMQVTDIIFNREEGWSTKLEKVLAQEIKKAEQRVREEAYLSHFSYDDWEIGDDDILRVGDYVYCNRQRSFDGHEEDFEGKIELHSTNKVPVILFNFDSKEESGEYVSLQELFIQGWTFSRIPEPNNLSTPKD